MPTYADRQALEQFFSSASITDWADKDRDGQLNSEEEQAVDRALEAAEATVDSYLSRGGYAAPFDATAFDELPLRLQSLIRQWTVVIAGMNLFSWRGLRDKANPFTQLHDRILRQLENVASGLPLAGLVRQNAVSFGFGGDSDTDPMANIQRDGWDW